MALKYILLCAGDFPDEVCGGRCSVCTKLTPFTTLFNNSMSMRRGGLRFGALTGLFYGVQLLSSVARNRRDMQDTIYAALVTGGVLGATSARSKALEHATQFDSMGSRGAV